MKQMNSQRLKLRRFKSDDWKDLYEYLSIPEVVLYEPYETFTKRECIDEAQRRSDQNNKNFWAVCLKNSSKMIGHIYFSQINPNRLKTWEIGYVFNPRYYGHGYATEAADRILKYGFENKGAHRIVAGVNVKNKPSWKLLERILMRREAHMLENVFFKKTPEGKPIWNDSYRYAILASEYFSKN